MTPLRWTAITAACGVLLAGVAIVAGEAPVRPGPPATVVSEQGMQRAYIRAERAANRLRLATIRDSLRGVLRGHDWPAESLLVILDPQLPAWRGATSAGRARTLWKAMGPKAGGIRVAYVARFAGHQNDPTTVLLPEAMDGRTCVVAEQFGGYMVGEQGRRVDEGDTTLVPSAKRSGYYTPGWREGQPLNACAFYAKFGAPGPKILAWLEDVEFFQATTPNFWSSSDQMPPLYQSIDAPFSGGDFKDRVQGYLELMLVSPTGLEDAAASRCASGVTSECPAVALSGSGGASDPDDGFERGMPLRRPRQFFYGIVGPRRYADFRPRLLADMARDVGVERFKKIWTSSKPIAEAYAEVTGTPFDVGMLDYVRRSVGGSASIGPSIDRRPIASGLALVALLLFGVTGRFSRREHR